MERGCEEMMKAATAERDERLGKLKTVSWRFGGGTAEMEE